MKRFFLCFCILALILSGCAAKGTDISPEEIINIYEKAGFECSYSVYDPKLEVGILSAIQADHPDGAYIYFAFFETEAEAKAYEENFDHPMMKGLFSVIFGKPTWERMETCGSIVVTYYDSDHFEPFEKLMKGEP